MSNWEEAAGRLRAADVRLAETCEPDSCLQALTERGEALRQLLALAPEDGADGEALRRELEREYASGEEHLRRWVGWRDEIRTKLQEQHALKLLSKTLQPPQRGTLIHRLS